LEKENDLPLDVIDSVYFYIGDLKEMILSTLQTQNQYIDDIGSKLFESEHLTEQDVQHLKEGAKMDKRSDKYYHRVFYFTPSKYSSKDARKKLRKPCGAFKQILRISKAT
jgi:hypothetical protein